MNIEIKKNTSNGDSYDILLNGETLFYQPWVQFPDKEKLKARDQACEYIEKAIKFYEENNN